MSDVRETQLLVIGGGPGGYPAALHAADHGMKVTLVDEDPKLGGVCLNRGCIPSKALLHTAKIIREAHEMAEHGVSFGEPKIDLEKLRAFVQQKVVGKLTGGIGQLTKGRGVEVVKGHAAFIDPHTVQVTGETTATHQVPELHHRHRFGAGRAEAVATQRPARHGQHRGAAAPRHPEEAARHRRRLHRPRNRQRLRRARQQGHGGRSARRRSWRWPTATWSRRSRRGCGPSSRRSTPARRSRRWRRRRTASSSRSKGRTCRGRSPSTACWCRSAGGRTSPTSGSTRPA